MRELGPRQIVCLVPSFLYCTMAGWLQNRLLSAGWRHGWRMPGVSLRALWPSSSSFIKAHTAFRSRQHTFWNCLAKAWRLGTQMLSADLNTDGCFMASACQLTKLGIERSTHTWISHYIRMCLRVRDPLPPSTPWLEWKQWGRCGFNWCHFYVITLRNTPWCNVDTLTPMEECWRQWNELNMYACVNL